MQCCSSISLQAADAAADDHAAADTESSCVEVDPRLLDRLEGAVHGELAEAVEAFDFLRRQAIAGVEVFDFAAEMDFEFANSRTVRAG